MNNELTVEKTKRFEEMKAANERLLVFGFSIFVFVVAVSVMLWMNQAWVDNFMGNGGPWGRPALQSLDAIQPQTAREAYILKIFRGVIPLPIVAVKNSFIYSTLMWLLALSLMIIKFARRQKKDLDFIKGIIKNEDH